MERPVRRPTLICAVATLALLAALAVAAVRSASAEPTDRARLKPLIEASTLAPWPWNQPTPFELPDSSGKLRALARDFRGQVVFLYMFAEW